MTDMPITTAGSARRLHNGWLLFHAVFLPCIILHTGIGDDRGVFGCMGLLACDNVCLKQIPLQDQLGIMRRMATMESVRGILPEFLRKKLQGCGCAGA